MSDPEQPVPSGITTAWLLFLHSKISYKRDMHKNIIKCLKTMPCTYETYCSGSSIGSGTGYIITPLISSSAIKMTCSHSGSELLDETIAFDKAEAANANITQTNLITVSSFNGINGIVWGYDIASQPLKPHPLYEDQDNRIFDLQPLCDATLSLYGTVEKKRFPVAPGEHLICAYKTIKKRGPTTIYGSLALAIAKDRSQNADLLMEDLGTLNTNSEEAQRKILNNLIKSVDAISENTKVKYERIFLGVKTQDVAEDEIGCLITAAPYINLAKKAVPKNKLKNLMTYSLDEWERAVIL